jgi:hypothetical protein
VLKTPYYLGQYGSSCPVIGPVGLSFGSALFLKGVSDMNLVEVEKVLVSKKSKLEKAMARLEHAMSLLTERVPVSKANGHEAPTRSYKKRKPKKGPHANRVLQGRYMGSVRNLSAAQKKEVKELKAEKGYIAAIKLAKSYAEKA